MIDEEGDWYLEPIRLNGVYTVEPSDGFVAMKKVKFDVKVPTELNTLKEDVNMVDDGFKVNVEVQTSPESEVIELKEYITLATDRVVKEVGSQGANLVQIFTNVSNGLNELNRNINSSVEDLNASYNNIENIVITKYEDVIASNQSVIETVNDQGDNVIAKVTEFNNNTIAQLNDIQDEVKSNSSGLNKLKMLISSERDQTDGFRVFKQSKKFIKGVVNRDSMQTEDPSNPSPSNNLNLKSIKRFRGDRGPPDVSEPVKGVYYYNKFISIDDINSLYSTNDYAMFDINSLNEIRLLDNVNVNITRNNDQFTWNIVNDYINTNLNISQDYPQGFNPIGVTNFTFNVAIDDIRLKNMNEWEQLSQYAFANNNTALIKYNPNNRVDPQEITNRVVELDEYQGDGVTIYDPNEKIFINNHKYTFSEENEEYDEDIEGFKSVMQTSIVPIMDRIVLPEITSNKTLRYSIEDFNNIYSLSPGSQNTYRNDFIGFNTIDIPVNINTKTVPLLATQDGIYRPSDIDPTAIGFSSVQVSTTTREGGGSGGDVTLIKNLKGYTFNHNTNHPYTINEYNSSQYPNTDYTGFDEINVNVGELENLNVDIKNIGDYKLNYNLGIINVIPVLSSNDSNGIVLSGSGVYNNDYTYWKMFDGDISTFFITNNYVNTGFFVLESINEIEFDVVKIICGYTRKMNEFRIYNWNNEEEDYILEYNNDNLLVGPNNNDTINDLDLNKKIKGTKFKFEFVGYGTNNGSGYNNGVGIRTLELGRYSGGYKNVNINVNTGNLLMDYSKTINVIGNNVRSTEYPFNFLTSEIPYMSGNSSVGANISIIDGTWSNVWCMFEERLNYNWAELTSENGSFLLTLDNEIDVRSIFISVYSVSSQSIKEMRVYGSNDNLDFELMYENLNVYNESVLWYNEEQYIYDNIEYKGSFRYFKFEFKRIGTWRGLIRTLRFYSENKYIGFENVTIINNTIPATSNPVLNSYNTNNQTINITTTDPNNINYINKGNLTVPLEVRNEYVLSNYLPVKIVPSSSAYGIKEINFSRVDTINTCEMLIPVDSVNRRDMIIKSFGNEYTNRNTLVYNGFYVFTSKDSINTYKLFRTEQYNETFKGGWCIISRDAPFILSKVGVLCTGTSGSGVLNSIEGTNDFVSYQNIISPMYITGTGTWYYCDISYNKTSWLAYRINFTGHYNNIWDWKRFQFYYCSDNLIQNQPVNLVNNFVYNTVNNGMFVINPPEGYNGFSNIIANVNVPTSVNNYNGYDSNNKLILNSNGDGIINIPQSYSGLGDVYYNVNVDVNNYNGYDNNNKYVINENGSGVISIPSGYNGLGEIHYEVNVPQMVLKDNYKPSNSSSNIDINLIDSNINGMNTEIEINIPNNTSSNNTEINITDINGNNYQVATGVTAIVVRVKSNNTGGYTISDENGNIIGRTENQVNKTNLLGVSVTNSSNSSVSKIISVNDNGLVTEFTMGSVNSAGSIRRYWIPSTISEGSLSNIDIDDMEDLNELYMLLNEDIVSTNNENDMGTLINNAKANFNIVNSLIKNNPNIVIDVKVCWYHAYNNTIGRDFTYHINNYYTTSSAIGEAPSYGQSMVLNETRYTYDGVEGGIYVERFCYWVIRVRSLS